LTLAEMKAAAADAGIDPELVERAARIRAARSSETRFERLIGGPVRHSSGVRLRVPLDEAEAARLLAAVRILAEQPGSGHASSAGMVWHARDEIETFRITAQPVDGGTSVAVHIDRGGLLALLQIATVIGSVVATAGGMALGDQVGPVVGAAAGAAGVGGILAIGRSYWASSTRRIRQRIDELMAAMSEAVGRPASLRSPADPGGEAEHAQE
jgi:hypothetical protein